MNGVRLLPLRRAIHLTQNISFEGAMSDEPLRCLSVYELPIKLNSIQINVESFE
jgi:hypothetical protein